MNATNDLTKMTAADLTNTYNALTGKELKVGSYSKAKLIAMIDAAQDDLPVREMQDVADADPKPEADDKPELVAVADIARELDLNPKVVRARLRRIYASGNIENLPAPQTGWKFLPADREAITKIIKKD